MMHSVRRGTWSLCLAALFTLSGCGLGLCVGRCLSAVSLASVIPVLTLTPKWQRLDATWSAATSANGYLLVRSAGVAVSWTPTDGEVYTAGQTVGGTHVVVLAGSWTTASDTSLTNGSTYYYRVFAYTSSYQYTAGATAQATAGLPCPANYLAVGPNTGVGVSDAFCVAKYEMKNDGSNNAVSQAAGLPWVNIRRDDNAGTPGAISRCQSIGSGYDLISNAQWQAMAREIEPAQSGGVYLNWSNGTTAGANALNRGHSDIDPANRLAASVDTDPCSGNNNANCDNNAHPDFTQKRTSTLGSGEVIWDAAGNVYEWVKGDIAAGPPYEGTGAYVSQQPWLSGLNHPEMWGPFGNYTAKNSGEYGGMGYGNLGLSAGAIVRGGDWSNNAFGGLFATSLNNSPLVLGATIGFRCVVIP